jgi:hypothetical protein
MPDFRNPFEQPPEESRDSAFVIPPVDLDGSYVGPNFDPTPDVVIVPPDDRGTNATPEETQAPGQPMEAEPALGILGIDGANRIHRDQDPDNTPGERELAETTNTPPQEETPPPPTDNSGGDIPPNGPENPPPSAAEEPPERGEQLSNTIPEGKLPEVTHDTRMRVVHEMGQNPELLAGVLARLQKEQPQLLETITDFTDLQATTQQEAALIAATLALAYRLLEEQTAQKGIDATTNNPEATAVPDEISITEEEISALASEKHAPTEPFLDFRQPFDDARQEISPEEQHTAGTVFEEKVESFLWQSGRDPRPDLVCFDVTHEGRFISITVKDEGRDVYVEVEEIPPDSTKGELVEYYIAPRGEVRRIDTAAPTEIEMEFQQLDWMKENEAQGPFPLGVSAVEKAEQVDAAHLAEATLGINNLPVGLEEVNKLFALLNGLLKDLPSDHIRYG